VHLHVHLHAITATPTREARMILDVAIIAVGVLVFVVPELVSVLRRTRRPAAEERRLLDGERQRLVRERRRLAAERAELAGRTPRAAPGAASRSRHGESHVPPCRVGPLGTARMHDSPAPFGDGGSEPGGR
jgi:hypothetical protein